VTGVFEILSVASSSRGSSAASTPPSTGMGKAPQARVVQYDIRPAVIQDIQELLEELDSCEHNISELATQVIYKNEVILTYGLPPSVHKLLLRAAQKREFTLIVVVDEIADINKQASAAVMNRPVCGEEAAGDDQEAAARKSLQDRGIQVMVIMYHDLENLMPRVNKVIVAARYIFADAGIVAVTGTAGVLLVAKQHRKLVYTVAGTHMFCPMTTCGPYGLLERGPPDIALRKIRFSSVLVRFLLTVLVSVAYNPERCRPATILSEYIESGSVDCFITNKYVFFSFLLFKMLMHYIAVLLHLIVLTVLSWKCIILLSVICSSLATGGVLERFSCKKSFPRYIRDFTFYLGY